MSDLEQMQKQLELLKESMDLVLFRVLMDIILRENAIWTLENRIDELTPKTNLANLSENRRRLIK